MLDKMNFRSILPILGLLIIVSLSCERPNSSDFKVNHSAKSPLLTSAKFKFLGQESAIIDTTTDDFDSLFTVNQTPGVDSGMVSLSREEDIDMGDFDDAVPEIDSDPKVLSSQVGQISGEQGDPNTAEVGNFEPSFNGSGAASFSEVVGNDPPPSGTPIAAGSSTIRIPLDAGNFVSATIFDGGILVEFQNDLGFNISSLDAQLYGNTDGSEVAVGSQISNTSTINNGGTYSDVINFNQGEVLETELQVQVTIEWQSQNYQGGDASLNVTATDDNLVVSEAQSDIPQQELAPNTPDIQLADPDFEFAELTDNNEGGQLNQLNLEITNDTNLPLTNSQSTGLPTITIQNSNGDVLDSQQTLQVEGQPNATQLESGETGTITFDLSGERLTRSLSYNLNLGTAGGNGVEVSSSDAVTITSSTTDLEVATARLQMDSESIETGDSIQLDDNQFQFSQSDHYIKLDSGSLVIDSLINDLSTNISNLSIKVNDIFTPDGDTLELSFEGDSDGPEGSYQYRRISANETDSDREPISIDLENFQIRAINNNIEYELYGETQATNGAINISSSDQVNANLQILNLGVKEARGVVTQKEILLNEDEGNDDILELSNDNEAEVQEFSDLEDISERIGETKFFNTGFDLIYDINLGVPARIYAVIVGRNSEGKEVFLKPKQGGPYEVDNTSYIQGLQVNGEQVSKENVLMLPVEAAKQMGETFSNSVSFGQTNSNVDEFLSNFPTEIRFIGKAVANPHNEEGFVVTPIDFSSNVGFSIPINFANSQGSEVLKDTLDADLSDLPNPEDGDSKLQNSKLRIKYENKLPMSMDLNLKFLDEQENVVTEVPLDGDPISLDAPEIDETSRFATNPRSGEMVISLTDEQSAMLHRTRKIRLGGDFMTPQGSGGSHQVKIRSSDYIEVSIFGDFEIETEVN